MTDKPKYLIGPKYLIRWLDEDHLEDCEEEDLDYNHYKYMMTSLARNERDVLEILDAYDSIKNWSSSIKSDEYPSVEFDIETFDNFRDVGYHGSDRKVFEIYELSERSFTKEELDDLLRESFHEMWEEHKKEWEENKLARSRMETTFIEDRKTFETLKKKYGW